MNLNKLIVILSVVIVILLGLLGYWFLGKGVINLASIGKENNSINQASIDWLEVVSESKNKSLVINNRQGIIEFVNNVGFFDDEQYWWQWEPFGITVKNHPKKIELVLTDEVQGELKPDSVRSVNTYSVITKNDVLVIKMQTRSSGVEANKIVSNQFIEAINLNSYAGEDSMVSFKEKYSGDNLLLRVEQNGFLGL